MDDGKLRALLTAVECGSFTKAAEQLNYSQLLSFDHCSTYRDMEQCHLLL